MFHRLLFYLSRYLTSAHFKSNNLHVKWKLLPYWKNHYVSRILWLLILPKMENFQKSSSGKCLEISEFHLDHRCYPIKMTMVIDLKFYFPPKSDVDIFFFMDLKNSLPFNVFLSSHFCLVKQLCWVGRTDEWG